MMSNVTTVDPYKRLIIKWILVFVRKNAATLNSAQVDEVTSRQVS